MTLFTTLANNIYAAWRHIFAPRHILAAQLVISSFAINILMLAMPIVTLQIYDRVIINKQGGTLTLLIAVTVAVVAIEMVLRATRSYIFTLSANSFEYRKMGAVMRAIVYAAPNDTPRQNTGEYIQVLSALGRMKEFAGERLITLAVEVPFLFVFIALLFHIGSWVALAPLVITASFIIVAWRLGTRLQTAISERNASDEFRYGSILEALSGIHTIKGTGSEPRFIRRFEDLQARAGMINFRTALLNHNIGTCGSIFSQIIIVAVVAGGAPLALNGSITMGALIACVLLSGRLIQPLQAILSLWIGYQEYQQASQRVANAIALPMHTTSSLTLGYKREGTIEVTNLSFTYNVQSSFIIAKSGFSILPGEMVALRGPNGSGRSTLLRLMAGLLEPVRGRILIDGKEPYTYTSDDLAHHIAYLSSDAVLFRGTIMQNITGFNAEHEENAKEIAILLGIDRLTSLLPGGYDTMLDGGAAESIPPGFRQRLNIARALLHKPRVILFDKADRSLDHEGYNHLFRLLARLKGRATIVIASDDHNLLKLADREMVLTHGAMHEVQRQTLAHYVLPRLSTQKEVGYGVHA